CASRQSHSRFEL
ncbi:PBP superfamily domain protein, partial [Vibrio parahaemolyticus EKP-028]